MRHNPARGIAMAAIALSVSLLVLPLPALAQEPVTQPDSVQRDSVARDSMPPDTRRQPVHSPLILLLIPVGMFGVLMMVAAPASLAFVGGPMHPAPLDIVDRHRAAYVTLGGLFYEGETVAHSVNLEMIQKGVIAELKVEDFYRPGHFQYITGRAGYLFRRNASEAGGVTLGYRHAHRDPTQSGLEIGLPVFIAAADSSGIMRLEATYVVSRHGVLWSYRGQHEFHLPETPYIAGFSAVVKSYPLTPGHPRHDLPRKSLYVGAVTVLFGARF